MILEYIDHFFESSLLVIIHLLEWMGIAVITIMATKAFIQYLWRGFNFTDDRIKVNLAKALAVGLEFKLAAEILRTVLVQTLDEVYMLAAIVVLRVVLTYVIHWEIEMYEKKHGPKS